MKKLILVASLVSNLVACGTVNTHKKAQAAATQKDGGGVAGASDCLFLGDPSMPDYGQPAGNSYDNGYDNGGTDVQIYVPGQGIPQGPSQNPYQPNFDVTVPQPPQTTLPPTPYYPPTGNTPYAPCKAQSPTQSPGDAYHPLGTEPQPYPAQSPIVATECGKNGKFCDYGSQGTAQYPAQTALGESYDQRDVDGCFDAFRKGGYDTKGMWNIVVKQSQVGVLSHTTITDIGTTPSLVIINAVNVIGSTDFQLLNPNALYCVKSVSILQNTHVASCLGSNVVFGKDVSVLNRAQNDVVACHY